MSLIFYYYYYYFFLGRGVPNQLQAAMDRTIKVSQTVVPSVKEAVRLYEQQGGHLTMWPYYATDPLSGSQSLSDTRWEAFHHHFPDYIKMYEGIVNGSPLMFQNAVQFLRDTNYYYCSSL